MGVIFAIGITIIALMAILALLRYVIVAGRYSADRFVATNLAMEGIEIVRAIRDSNWLATSPPKTWNEGLDAGEYLVDYRNTSLLPFANQFLNISNIDPYPKGYYSYDAGQPTKFKRKITLDPASTGCSDYPDDCISVLSEVTWGANSVVLEDRLYNWHP